MSELATPAVRSSSISTANSQGSRCNAHAGPWPPAGGKGRFGFVRLELRQRRVNGEERSWWAFLQGCGTGETVTAFTTFCKGRRHQLGTRNLASWEPEKPATPAPAFPVRSTRGKVRCDGLARAIHARGDVPYPFERRRSGRREAMSNEQTNPARGECQWGGAANLQIFMLALPAAADPKQPPGRAAISCGPPVYQGFSVKHCGLSTATACAAGPSVGRRGTTSSRVRVELRGAGRTVCRRHNSCRL